MCPSLSRTKHKAHEVSKAHGALLTACRNRVVLPLAGRNVPEQYETVSIQERHTRHPSNFEGVAQKKLLELEPVFFMRKLRIVFAKTGTA